MDPFIPFDAARAEFWGDLQRDFYTTTSTLYLANQSLESVISTNGNKAHRPILSNPSMFNYVPHTDITFDRKVAETQELTVDTFPAAAEVMDITETNQTPYDLLGHSLRAIREGLINRVEQLYLSQIPNALNKINSGVPLILNTSNVLGIIEEADGQLGALDAPVDTESRAAVFGPRNIALMRNVKAERETRLGDRTLEDGRIGPWQGWTFVSNNNLPTSFTLTLATNPTNLDKFTILGRGFEFRTNLATGTAGYIGILIGANAGETRDHVVAAFNHDTGEGTDYQAFDNLTAFMLRNKRHITAEEVSTTVVFSGYGDIGGTTDLTNATDGWTAATQTSVFMIRGAIDLVMQFRDLQIDQKEKGFATLTKGIIGAGAKMFQDGALMSVEVPLNVLSWFENL